MIVSVTVTAEAKGRKSWTRRIFTTLVPGDYVVAVGKDGNILFELSVESFAKVSTVIPLDK